MKPSIATVIADVASSAFRGFGTARPIAAARPSGRLAQPPWLGGRQPAFDLVLVKIELNFHR